MAKIKKNASNQKVYLASLLFYIFFYISHQSLIWWENVWKQHRKRNVKIFRCLGMSNVKDEIISSKSQHISLQVEDILQLNNFNIFNDEGFFFFNKKILIFSYFFWNAKGTVTFTLLLYLSKIGVIQFLNSISI